MPVENKTSELGFRKLWLFIRISTVAFLTIFSLHSSLAYSDIFIKRSLWNNFSPSVIAVLLPDAKNSKFEGIFIMSARRGHHSSSAANIVLCNSGDFLFWGAEGGPSFTDGSLFLASKGKVNSEVASEIRENAEYSFLSLQNIRRDDLDFSYLFAKLNLTKGSKMTNSFYDRNLIDDVDSARIDSDKFIGKLWIPKDSSQFKIPGIQSEIENSKCGEYIARLSENIRIVDVKRETSLPKEFMFFIEEWWQKGIDLSSP